MQCILILFTPHSSPNSWIHPQPLPPSNLPQLPDFFLKNNSLSPVCAFHVFKDVWLSTDVWSTYQWLDPWRTIGSASLRSHQLSQAPQLWVGGSKVSPPAVLEFHWLAPMQTTTAGMSSWVPSYPEDTVSVWASSTSDSYSLSGLLSRMTPGACMVRDAAAVLTVWALHWRSLCTLGPVVSFSAHYQPVQRGSPWGKSEHCTSL